MSERKPRTPRRKYSRTSRRFRTQKPQRGQRRTTPASPLAYGFFPGSSPPAFVKLDWADYAVTGVTIAIRITSIRSHTKRLRLRGQGLIPASMNETLDQKSSPILMDIDMWLDFLVPRKLRSALEECLGEGWRKEVMGKLLIIICYGKTSPETLKPKTGGYYGFELRVYSEDGKTLIAESTATTKQEEE